MIPPSKIIAPNGITLSFHASAILLHRREPLPRKILNGALTLSWAPRHSLAGCNPWAKRPERIRMDRQIFTLSLGLAGLLLLPQLCRAAELVLPG
jgi:hypothetical protein